MEVEKLKQNVLMDLRSVIQSCKGGVPLNRLQNDYKLLIGSTIPFTNLGYRSLEAFLQSIPQVIKLKKNSEGQVIAEAVADSSTVHLQNLISKQKSTKTQKCSVKRYGKRPAPKLKSSLCPNCASAKSAYTNCNGAHSSASSSWSIASEVSNEKDKEIEALKGKLAEEKEMNAILRSRVNQLLSQSEPNLEDERLMIQRMKYQIQQLQKRILLRNSASSEALQVNRNINEIAEKIGHLGVIVEKLAPHLTKVNSSDGNVKQVSKDDPFTLLQRKCKEIEELKKQVQLNNSPIQNIERRIQSQLQKLQNQINTDSPSTLSKEQLKSELMEDLKNQLQEQNVQIQNVEKNMTLELTNLKNRVDQEYLVHLISQSEKLKEMEKELKKQKSQLLNVDCGMQSKLKKLKNKVDKINMNNIADMMVKKLVSRNLINISQILSAVNNHPQDEQMQQPTEEVSNSSVISVQKSSTSKSSRRGKKKSKALKPVPQPTATISSVMRDR